MKKLRRTARQIAEYSYSRYCRATNQKARLFWLNRHFETDCKERLLEVRGVEE